MLNEFRVVGDIIHIASFIGILCHIIQTRSCPGLSLKTHILFAVTFIFRYTDLFTNYISLYNTVFKVAFIAVTLALCVLIHFYSLRSTHDLKHDGYRLEFILLPTAFITFCWWTNNNLPEYQDIFWAFSIYLEAFAILPQLYLVLKKGEADPIIAFYICGLWMYRVMYVINWYYRYLNEDFYDIISISGGLLQVMLYSLFMCLPFKFVRRNVKQEDAKLYIITRSKVSKEKVGFHDDSGMKEPSKIIVA